MIIVKLQGGLANKMFQFGYYAYLKNKGYDIYMDNISFKPAWDFEDIKLSDVFPNIKIKYSATGAIIRLGGGETFINKLRRKLSPYINGTFVNEGSSINEHFYKNLETNKNYYLQGTWSSNLYIKDIKNIIAENLVFKELTASKNIQLKRQLESQNSIAIHFRKGADYNKKLMYGTCEKNYYINSIEYIKKRVDNPKFYIFTDNVSWVKENISDLDYTLVDWNPVSGKDNYLDLQLMSYAKHNIIANSTYSWWSAWLNSNPNKIIIGPKNWFNPKVIEYSDKNKIMLPNDWTAL